MTARQTYTQRRTEVTAQIAALQAALARLDADHAARPKDWRIVGDLGHVCGELQTVLDFITSAED